MKIKDWSYAAFMATLLATTAVLFINLLIEIPYQWQHIAFTGMPTTACGIVVFLPRVWRRMRERTSIEARPGSRPPIEEHIDDIWGPSLEKMTETIDLAEQRVQDAHERLQATLKEAKTPLYLILELGYKSIRLARAIRCLCANGFPDEAYSLCRNLMELEVNIRFIMVSGDAEGICRRYNAWDNAKFYRYVRDNRSKLNPPPSEDEWERMTDEYQKCVDEYGEENLNNEEAWAIAYREGGSKEVKVQNVTDRAFHSMPYLDSDRHLLHEVWKSRWSHLNSMTHNSPRSIMTSQAASKEGEIVTGQSAFRLRDPIEDVARMVLNISSTIADNIPAEKTEKSEKLGKQTMDAALETAEILTEVPAIANPWWQHSEQM